jgi:DNA-binding transcriptional regulator YdaS (Cro superfamily)
MGKRRDAFRELPRPMTGEQLATFGSLAYGVGWQTALAADIGMSRATVNRWARGRCRILDGRTLEISALCLARAKRKLADLKKLHEEIMRSLIDLGRGRGILGSADVTPVRHPAWRPLTRNRLRD